ncbi:Endothiapepsin [Metarhizium brunneum]|uniref:Endothiapepsin n=1 Tax=Metarhizium brunneum TaxID=500148 RepID=A0A7D5Z5R5_9HYPO
MPSLKTLAFASISLSAVEVAASTFSLAAEPIPGKVNEFVVEVELGTPPQKLPLVPDTGSTDFWVYSTDTESSWNNHKLWDIPKSTTARNLTGYTWKITYGTGYADGTNIYEDVVTLGGVPFPNQAIESASRTDYKVDPKISGIFGLEFRPDQTGVNQAGEHVKTWSSTHIKSLDQPLFTSHFKFNGGGSLDFGFIDNTKYTGSITYTPVTHDQHWMFNSTGYKIGDDPVQVEELQAVADTGTSGIFVPENVARAYYRKVPTSTGGGNFQYVFKCGNPLPDFSFNVENTVITIPGKYLDLGPTGLPQNGFCLSAIQRGKTTIFGTPALQAAFVVYDVGNRRLGFASPA